MAKKKSSKSTQSKVKVTNTRLPMAALMQLNEAQVAFDDGDVEGAHELLVHLNQRFPRRAEILEELAYACAEVKDARGLQSATRALIEVAPAKTADWLPTLAQSYLMNMHPALALRTYEDYLQRFPDHEKAAEVRQARGEMQPRAQELVDSLPFPAARRGELALLHDELNVALESGELERAETVAKQLLEAAPDFVPALNNLAQAQWLAGQREQAVESSKHILNSQPDNVHALGNLTRFYVLLGRSDEAARFAKLLVKSDARAFEADFKKAEALAYVGDDAGIIALYERCEDEAPASDFVHLAAVAYSRQGQLERAQKLWEQSLQMPGALAEVAKANLANSRLPEGKRLAPWPFGFAQWIEKKTLEELEKQLRAIAGASPKTPVAREREKRAQQQMLAEFSARHAGLEACLSAQLDRGDAAGVQLALMVADMGRPPQLLEALRAFALGRQSSDGLRTRAAQIASEAGFIPSGATLMWAQGEQRELMLTNFEITTEPTRPMSAGNRKAAAAIHAAMHAGDFAEAEVLSRAALEKYPNDVSLRFNFAQTLKQQGHDGQALEIVRAIHQENPAYVLARVSLAMRHTKNGETEAAHALLDPLMQTRQFHVTEFSLWMRAQIELLLLEENVEVAQSWLDMWQSMSEQLDYEHPALKISRDRVKKAARKRK